MKRKTLPLPSDWTILEEIRANGRILVRGTEFSVIGERGRFRFVKYVQTGAGIEWIDAIGGPSGREAWRAFLPSQVRTVHAKSKTRANA